MATFAIEIIGEIKKTAEYLEDSRNREHCPEYHPVDILGMAE